MGFWVYDLPMEGWGEKGVVPLDAWLHRSLTGGQGRRRPPQTPPIAIIWAAITLTPVPPPNSLLPTCSSVSERAKSKGSKLVPRLTVSWHLFCLRWLGAALLSSLIGPGLFLCGEGQRDRAAGKGRL